MAATFTVEDGSGLAAANSYLSVTDADQYHLEHSASTDWSGATEANKQKALRLATQYADSRYNGRWRGYKNTSTQALAWPRYSGVDSEGFVIASDAVPQRLKDAVAELALRVVQGDTLLADIAKPAAISSQSITVGPISKSVSYVGGMPPTKKYALIEALMAPLIQSSNTVERG